MGFATLRGECSVIPLLVKFDRVPTNAQISCLLVCSLCVKP